MVLEKTLESLLDTKKIKTVNPKEIQPQILTGRTDAEAETLILCHLMGRTDSFEKTLMQGKIKGRRQSRKTEDEIVSWHHRPDEHESEQALGVVIDRETWHTASHDIEKS